MASGNDQASQSLQDHIDGALDRLDIHCIVVRSIRDCHFSVSIADPQLPDIPLIAVSEGFCTLTGHDRETIIGSNCRFLNHGCDLKQRDRDGLRIASMTGQHFCSVLRNRKADGTFFMNLLDMRGLSVGKTASGEERFFIIGMQMDVSERGEQELCLEHKLQMQHIANTIREDIVSSLQEVSVVTAGSMTGIGSLGDITPFTEPKWMLGEVFEMEFLGG